MYRYKRDPSPGALVGFRAFRLAYSARVVTWSLCWALKWGPVGNPGPLRYPINARAHISEPFIKGPSV